jgi:hypothetical protein
VIFGLLWRRKARRYLRQLMVIRQYVGGGHYYIVPRGQANNILEATGENLGCYLFRTGTELRRRQVARRLLRDAMEEAKCNTIGPML